MRKKPNIGIGIIINKGAQTLLVKRKNVHGQGTWSTPGGSLEFGEGFEECAVRETREETGVKITNLRFKAITNDIFPQEDKHYVSIWLESDYLSGQPKVNADYEIDEVKWFDWQNLLDNIFLAFKNLIDGKCYPQPSLKYD